MTDIRDGLLPTKFATKSIKSGGRVGLLRVSAWLLAEEANLEDALTADRHIKEPNSVGKLQRQPLVAVPSLCTRSRLDVYIVTASLTGSASAAIAR